MQPDWKTYRTRFVVRARQLTEPFTFTDTNGHEHHGRTGDYVIESREGLRISRREIFEDVYVAMEAVGCIPSSSATEGNAFAPAERESGESQGEQSGGHGRGVHSPRVSANRVEGLSRAESNSSLMGALAPVQPPSERVNLPV
jgi:hypothetical protein